MSEYENQATPERLERSLGHDAVVAAVSAASGGVAGAVAAQVTNQILNRPKPPEPPKQELWTPPGAERE